MPKRSQVETASDKQNLNETSVTDTKDQDDVPVDKNALKKQTKERYLLEKYAYRWRHKVSVTSIHSAKIVVSENNCLCSYFK